MKKRNLFLLIFTTVISFALFSVNHSETVNAKKVKSSKVVSGVPKRFVGFWISHVADYNNSSYPQFKKVAAFYDVKNTHDIDFKLLYFDSSNKSQPGGNPNKFYNLKSQKVGKNTYNIFFSSKENIKNDSEIQIKFISNTVIDYKNIKLEGKKPQNYNVVQAIGKYTYDSSKKNWAPASN